jgi:hypothetical protein
VRSKYWFANGGVKIFFFLGGENMIFGKIYSVDLWNEEEKRL